MKRRLKEKEKEIERYRKLNEGYEKTINELVDKNMRLEKQERGKGDEERLKEKVLEKELELDSLQYKYRDLKEKGEENEKLICRQKRQLREWKEKLTTQKYNVASVMQELFETENQKALEIVSKHF